MTRSSIEECAGAIRAQYVAASKTEKGRMLGELCWATGRHPKSAMRLLRRKKRPAVGEKRRRPRRYGAAAKAALVVAWETLGRTVWEAVTAVPGGGGMWSFTENCSWMTSPCAVERGEQ